MKEVTTRTYNAIAFLDLEETFETLTPLGNQIAEAFEAGDTAELGRLYFQALKQQDVINEANREEFRRKVWRLSLEPEALRNGGVL